MTAIEYFDDDVYVLTGREDGKIDLVSWEAEGIIMSWSLASKNMPFNKEQVRIRTLKDCWLSYYDEAFI